MLTLKHRYSWAKQLLERFFVLRAEGVGEDYAYTGWYVDMLRLTGTDALPIAFADLLMSNEVLAQGHFETVGPRPVRPIPFP